MKQQSKTYAPDVVEALKGDMKREGFGDQYTRIQIAWAIGEIDRLRKVLTIIAQGPTEPPSLYEVNGDDSDDALIEYGRRLTRYALAGLAREVLK